MERDRSQSRDVGTRREEAGLPPQAERRHPEEWEQDLNPDRLEGQNIGIPQDLPSAHDFPDLRRSLTDLDAAELKHVAVVPPGSRLKQGATYLDLRDRERTEFTATGDRVAGDDDRLVPKAEVSYTLWNRLRGIDDPGRTT